MDQVVVLNYDYSFLGIVDYKRAFSYISRGKVTIEKFAERVISTNEKTLKCPKVIRFAYMINQVYKRKIPWSKRNVCIRDGYKCGYCGIVDKHKMTIDHVLPKSRGGKNTFKNTVASCKPCNARKGDRTSKECNMHPRHKLEQPTVIQFMSCLYRSSDVDDIIKTIWE